MHLFSRLVQNVRKRRFRAENRLDVEQVAVCGGDGARGGESLYQGGGELQSTGQLLLIVTIGVAEPVILAGAESG